MLAELLRWLATPISGASDHAIAMALAWHGRLMVLAMGLLMPPSIIVARFFKVMPRQDWPRELDNPFWFITHRRWGHVAGAIAVIGVGFVLAERGWQSPLHNVHAAAGWLVVLLVLVQVIGAWLRGTHGGPVDPFTRKRRPRQLWPGDHFSMTSRRVIFEYVHKAAGYLLLALTVLALCTGLGRCATLDASRFGPLVACHGGHFRVVAVCRPLHRYLPGDLGPGPGTSGQPPASDRLRRRAPADDERHPACAGT